MATASLFLAARMRACEAVCSVGGAQLDLGLRSRGPRSRAGGSATRGEWDGATLNFGRVPFGGVATISSSISRMGGGRCPPLTAHPPDRSLWSKPIGPHRLFCAQHVRPPSPVHPARPMTPADVPLGCWHVTKFRRPASLPRVVQPAVVTLWDAPRNDSLGCSWA